MVDAGAMRSAIVIDGQPAPKYKGLLESLILRRGAEWR
jgi:hypothetical protein